MPRILASYESPPISEVGFGVRFEVWERWKSPHAGLFWQRVIQEFPQCRHAPPVQPFTQDEAGLVFPRIWLINESDDRLIQLQPDRFLYNWRTRASDDPYPHFSNLLSEFLKYFDSYIKFCFEYKIGQPNIIEFELTYVNHIYNDTDKGAQDDIDHILRIFNWVDSDYKFLRRPKQSHWQSVFSLPDSQGDLSVIVGPATRVGDERPALGMQLSARGCPQESPLDRMTDWFSLAHEWIVRGFEDLTTERAQREMWGKHDSN